MIAKTIGLKMSSDPRGKISAGRRNAEGRGEKLEYFNVSKYPEVVALYGEKPNKLWVAVSSDDIEQVITAPFEKWVGGDIRVNKQGTRQRVCDGQTCIHRLDVVIAGEKYAAGTTTECVCLKHGLFEIENKDDRRKLACQCDINFTAHILHPETKGLLTFHPVRFFTQSQNSAKAILGALTALQHITSVELRTERPVLRMIPLILMVKMVEDRKDPKVKFPVWDCVIAIEPAQLAQKLLAEAETRGLPQATVKHLQLLSGGGVAQIAAPQSLPQRIEYEIALAKTKEALKAVSDKINNKVEVGELLESDAEQLQKAGRKRQTELFGDAVQQSQ